MRSEKVCIDFTNLNKVCPKGNCPFTRIDSITGYELLSFLDTYSGYYQIFIVRQDSEMTSFINDQNTYKYNMMPFGLKNAGATFKRLINKVFFSIIGRNIEIYIDDIVTRERKLKSILMIQRKILVF